MRRRAFVLAIILALLPSCGNDDQASDQLTAAEREWCTLTERTDAAALRFDIIFEAGLQLELKMDTMNATAARLFDEYVAQGLSEDAAVAAVSADLLDDPDYRAACRLAYSQELGGDG